jgi:hypothetical protein
MNWKVSHVSGSHTQEVCSCINFVHLEMIYGVSWDRRFPEGNREHLEKGVCVGEIFTWARVQIQQVLNCEVRVLLHVKLGAHFYKPVIPLEDR